VVVLGLPAVILLESCPRVTRDHLSAQRPEIEDAAIFLPFADDTEINFLVVFVVIRLSSSYIMDREKERKFFEIVSYQQDQFRGI